MSFVIGFRTDISEKGLRAGSVRRDDVAVKAARSLRA